MAIPFITTGFSPISTQPQRGFLAVNFLILNISVGRPSRLRPNEVNIIYNQMGQKSVEGGDDCLISLLVTSGHFWPQPPWRQSPLQPTFPEPPLSR
jgi:hypothetical protein